ncbi:MAG: DUF1573 domain-containing protein [Bacteroidia bacterium]
MLKKIIVVAFFILSKISYSQNKLPELTFESTIYNFDTIPFDEPKSYSFKFKNTGKADLLIKNIISTCGCSVPEWNKLPYKRKAKGVIKITFNARTKGSFFKTLIVESNGKTSTQAIIIRGFVK